MKYTIPEEAWLKPVTKNVNRLEDCFKQLEAWKTDWKERIPSPELEIVEDGLKSMLVTILTLKEIAK